MLKSSFRQPSPPSDAENVSLKELAEFAARAKLEHRIRSRAHYAYLGDATGLVTVLGRYKMYVNTDDHSISPHLIMEGFWEIWNTAAVCRLVKPGMRVLEIGAHLGYFGLLMADLVGDEGSYVGFEPNPRLAKLFDRSLMINGFSGRARVERLAAYDRSERRRLVSPAGQFGGASIMHEKSFGAEGISEEVQTVRLDEWIKADARPDFIKIDAEGAEQRILNGLEQILATPNPLTLFIEFDIGRGADWPAHLLRLEDFGFALHRVEFDSSLTKFDAIAPDFRPGDLFELCAIRS